MRDLMEMAYEAHEKAEGQVLEQREIFWETLLEELKKMKGEDIAPHLSCVFDVIKNEYKIELRFPVRFHKMDSFKSDIK